MLSIRWHIDEFSSLHGEGDLGTVGPNEPENAFTVYDEANLVVGMKVCWRKFLQRPCEAWKISVQHDQVACLVPLFLLQLLEVVVEACEYLFLLI